jgi:RNA-directed DNA polymerase
MDSSMGNTEGTLEPRNVLTKQRRIAKLAKQSPQMAFTSLNHFLDEEWMKEAYRRLKKSSAPGVDGETVEEYGKKLEERVRDLLERVKSGRYVAPPVQRAYIPKGTGSETRPIGMPTTENKVLERAVVMLLEPIYEQDFLDCSKGFRPGRSAHQAVEELRSHLMGMVGGWVLDVDVRKFYDTLDHACMRDFLQLRVRDGVILRLIGKWLKAGVLEEGRLRYSEMGTPQGGVASPILSNIYLHYVLDLWFEQEVKPRMKGRAELTRFADDFVMAFRYERDARRVQAVLPKRFAKYGLAIHPEKTRLLSFHAPWRGRTYRTSFDFLGFTHYWGRSRSWSWVIKRKTARERMTRAVRAVWQWCRNHRHDSLEEQRKALSSKLRGHYNYYGITGNSTQLNGFYRTVERSWRFWLARRTRGNEAMPWPRFKQLLAHHSLPQPRAVRSEYAAKP